MQKHSTTEKKRLRKACAHAVKEKYGLCPQKVVMEQLGNSVYTVLFLYGHRSVILAEIPNRHAANLHVDLT